jgi:hypothetical protein
MRGLAAALLAACALGCASSSHYDWGRYEESVYLVTHRPDSFDLQAEIDQLESQLEQTSHRQRLPGPGLHAHLGFLHSMAGNVDAAKSHFQTEKELFPESARFMDNLMAMLTSPPRS